MRSSSYSAAAFNQYSSRTNAPGIDILGIANALATVTVSNQSTYRKGEYFQKALAINNAGGAVYPLVTNIATLSGVTNIEWGKVYVPPATESYIHDKDGNLTQDARWNYTWDAENRLINQEARNGSDPTASIAHGYDYRSRRIAIKVTETGGGFSTNRFIYNGWNVIAELNGGGVLQKSFVWGKDLSGSEQGAGGVGGLVMLVIHTNGTTGTYFPAYDGNGNLTALWKGSESSSGIKARYEYDPFHNVLRATGDIAKENNHLAATKYFCWRSGKYYYGFRHYDPDTGRWLSNDPIGERGGFNLYMVNHNNPMNKADFLGLAVNMWHSVSISCPKSCGLDYTAAVNAELSALNAYLSSAPKFPVNRNHLEIGGLFPSPEEDRQFQEYARYNSAFYAWFQEVARSLDYDKQARLAASGATPFGSCPSSACRNSITLCGQCVGDDVPGNILFGYLAAATGIRDSVRNLGAHAAESTDRDGEGPLDQDVDVFPLGKQLFQNNKLDVCTVLKALPVHATQSCTPCSKNGSFGRPTPFLSVQYPKY